MISTFVKNCNQIHFIRFQLINILIHTLITTTTMTKTQQPAVFTFTPLYLTVMVLWLTPLVISEFWRFRKTRPHVDPEEIIRTSHGCRTFDVIAKWSPEDAIEEQVTHGRCYS